MPFSINRRQIILSSSAIAASLALPRIALASDEGGTATGVRYARRDQINNGEPIRLEYWEWSGQRAEYQRAWAEAYSEMYPNVEIEIVLQPWDSYWPSLITNVPAGAGPAMWHMHASKMVEFCDGNLMDPIPASVADADYLNHHWIGFPEGAMSCPGTGSLHTVPMGAMMPLLFINLDKWQAAGLTEDDIPTTWDQLREVAALLTERDGRNRITVAGLSMDGQEWLQNAVYQQGRYLFNADGTQVQVQNPEYRAALQFIADLVHTDGTLDNEIASQRYDGFAAGQSAMYIGFSWIAGFLRANRPDMNWVAVLLPTPDGDLAPAYGNIRFAIEAVVNPYTDDTTKEVAWDFWHFNYSRDDVIVEDLALFNGFLPPYDQVLGDPRVEGDVLASTMSPAGGFGIINDLPNVVRDEQLELVTAVILGQGDLDTLMADSERAQNALLAERDNWNIIERNYANHAMMIADQ